MKPAAKYYTSDLSRFCAEELGPEFNFLDGDEVLLRYSAQPVTHARSTRILRVVESKNPGEEIRRSQRETFPILASALEFCVEAGILRKTSGVYIVEGLYPYSDGADVAQILPASQNRAVGMQMVGPMSQVAGAERFSRQQLDLLASCRPL